MAATENIALVKRLYDSGAAPDVVNEVMAPDLVWDITPGFPSGGVYNGIDGMLDFFGNRLVPLFDKWGAVAEEYYASGDDKVFVLGHYHAEKDGRTGDARFTHFWKIRDGKLAVMRQAADSGIVQQVAKG